MSMGPGFAQATIDSARDVKHRQLARAVLTVPPLPTPVSDFHGIQPLLGWALETISPDAWPVHWQAVGHGPLIDEYRCAWTRERLREWFRHRDLLQVLSTLTEAGLSPLLLKGAALAHRVYPHPTLRPRCDTDLLVTPEQRDTAIAALQSLGYQRTQREPRGERLSYQTTLYRRDEDGVCHAVDLHWRISNRQALAHTLVYGSLRSRAQALPTLPGALLPCRIHLLLHACLHRAGHLRERCQIAGQVLRAGNRLLWLYDIHLLVAALDAEDWRSLTEEAAALGLCRVLADGLGHTREHFDTPLPDGLLGALDAAGQESAAAYLRGSALSTLVTDFRTLDWRGRWQLGREMLFPPMARPGQETPGTLSLGWRYLRRLVRGGSRLLLAEGRARLLS